MRAPLTKRNPEPDQEAIADRRRRYRLQSEARLNHQLTTAEAAEELGVKAQTIRQWVSRGYLSSVGKNGRSNLYRRSDLLAARNAVQDRTLAPPRWANERAQDFDNLVTTKIAARIANVSPSTIRMWVKRGHLRPTGRRWQRQSVFTVVDVLRASRRRR